MSVMKQPVFSIQFLGTGTSVGVPQIGCKCPTCLSADVRDKRNRSALYVKSERAAFVIDTPPEFRSACLAYDIEKVDAVVLTHLHMDHVAGFDDVRRFNTINGNAPMRCYAAAETIESMKSVFPYITDKANDQGLFRPMINFVEVDGPFVIGDMKLTPLPVVHGPRTNGYLMECGGVRAGYISDCHIIPDETLELIKNVDLMVLNCLRDRPHPTHLNTQESLSYFEKINPKQGLMIHMCHDVRHEEFEKKLPPSIRLAYDGLKVEFSSKEMK